MNTSMSHAMTWQIQFSVIGGIEIERRFPKPLGSNPTAATVSFYAPITLRQIVSRIFTNLQYFTNISIRS